MWPHNPGIFFLVFDPIPVDVCHPGFGLLRRSYSQQKFFPFGKQNTCQFFGRHHLSDAGMG